MWSHSAGLAGSTVGLHWTARAGSAGARAQRRPPALARAGSVLPEAPMARSASSPRGLSGGRGAPNLAPRQVGHPVVLEPMSARDGSVGEIGTASGGTRPRWTPGGRARPAPSEARGELLAGSWKAARHLHSRTGRDGVRRDRQTTGKKQRYSEGPLHAVAALSRASRRLLRIAAAVS
jgi:hypothetical protein